MMCLYHLPVLGSVFCVASGTKTGVTCHYRLKAIPYRTYSDSRSSCHLPCFRIFYMKRKTEFQSIHSMRVTITRSCPPMKLQPMQRTVVSAPQCASLCDCTSFYKKRKTRIIRTLLRSNHTEIAFGYMIRTHSCCFRQGEVPVYRVFES